jgi:BMFP domain-containing protein YqiC
MPTDQEVWADACTNELVRQRDTMVSQLGTMVAQLRGELAVKDARIAALEAKQPKKKPPPKP